MEHEGKKKKDSSREGRTEGYYSVYYIDIKTYIYISKPIYTTCKLLNPVFALLSLRLRMPILIMFAL